MRTPYLVERAWTISSPSATIATCVMRLALFVSLSVQRNCRSPGRVAFFSTSLPPSSTPISS